MQKKIIKTLYSQSTVPEANWKNVRLWDQYNRIKNYPLTIIKSKAGSGKTTSIVNYFKKSGNQGVYWFRMKNKEYTIQDFWENIYLTFTINNSNIKKAGNRIVRKSQKSLSFFDQFLKEFINLLFDNLKSKSYLILDNFQYVQQNTNIINTFIEFIEYCPSNLHVIILTDSKLYHPGIAILKLKEKALLIDETIFSLNKEQIKDFMLLQHNIQLSEKELDLIYEKTEGWLTGVNLAAKCLEKGIEPASLFTCQREFCKLISDYFNLHLKSRLSEEEKAFIQQIPILDELNEEVCNYLTNKNNSGEILESLYEKGVFLNKEEQDKYRFHPLFKEFLLNEGSNKNIERLYNKALCYYSNNGDLEKVFYYLKKIREEEKIVKYLFRHYQVCFQKGKYHLLEKVLESLDKDIFYRYKRLYLIKGDIYCLKGDYGQAVKEYSIARKIAKKEKDHLTFVAGTFKIISLLFYNKLKERKRYLDEIDNYSNKLSGRQKALHCYFRVADKLIEGKVKEANCPLNYKGLHYNVESLNALYFLLKGDLTQARKRIETTEINFFLNPFQCVPFYFYLLTGEMDKARELVFRDKQNTLFLSKSRRAYNLLLINTLCNNGIRKKNFLAIIEQLKNKLFSKSSWYYYETYVICSLWEGYFDDPVKGVKYAQEGLEQLQEGDSYIQALLNYALGVNFFHLKEYVKARKEFLKASKIFYHMGLGLFYASVLLHLTLVEYHLEESSFETNLVKILNIIKEKSYEFLLTKTSLAGNWDNPSRFYPLLLEGYRKGIESEYISGILEKAGLTGIRSHPGYFINLKTFGGLEVNAGLERIIFKQGKLLELLLLFVVNYGEMLPLEHICRHLWPNKDLETAKNNFYVNLNRLNNILEPNRESGEEPFFIRGKDSRYGLRNCISIQYDVLKYLEYIEEGNKTDNKKLKHYYYQQANNIYIGDYLEGIDYLFVVEKRNQLKEIYVETNKKLIKYYYESGSYSKALVNIKNTLAVEKFDEDAYYYKMKCQYDLGERIKAIKAYQECKRILEEELGISPSRKIEKYYRFLKNAP